MYVKDAKISAIICTHWHHDHTGGCEGVLKSIVGDKVWEGGRNGLCTINLSFTLIYGAAMKNVVVDQHKVEEHDKDETALVPL